MSRESIIPAIITVAIGLGSAVLIGEVVVRIAGVSVPITYLPNPYFGWSHTANDRFSWTTEGNSIDITINSMGLRDFEHQYEKNPETHRTLVLADSFAEAFQVELPSSFPKLIESKLNTRQTHANSYRTVINSGTSGYGTDNELLFFRHEGYKYDPDIVLVAIYLGNDIRNNWYPLENIDAGGFKKPYFTPGTNSLEINAFPFEKHDSLTTKLKVFLNRNVRLYSLIRETANRFRSRELTDEDANTGIDLDTYLFLADYPSDWNFAWRVTKDLILELRDEAEKHNAQLFVAIIPTRFQVHEEIWRGKINASSAMQEMVWDLEKPNRILTEFLSENDIRYIDLLPGFRDRSKSSGQRYYLEQDGHWNHFGHELGAELITNGLLEIIESQ